MSVDKYWLSMEEQGSMFGDPYEGEEREDLMVIWVRVMGDGKGDKGWDGNGVGVDKDQIAGELTPDFLIGQHIWIKRKW